MHSEWNAIEEKSLVIRKYIGKRIADKKREGGIKLIFTIVFINFIGKNGRKREPVPGNFEHHWAHISVILYNMK